MTILFMLVMAVPLILSFIIVFAPFMGKRNDDGESVGLDYITVDIHKLCTLLQKNEAEYRRRQYKTRLKYSLVGYREG